MARRQGTGGLPFPCLCQPDRAGTPPSRRLRLATDRRCLSAFVEPRACMLEANATFSEANLCNRRALAPLNLAAERGKGNIRHLCDFAQREYSVLLSDGGDHLAFNQLYDPFLVFSCPLY